MSNAEPEDQERTDGWKRLLIARNDLAGSKKYLESYVAFADTPTYSEAYGALGLDMARTMENALLSYGLISYARPFTDSRGGKWARVPGRFTSSFTREERQIHDYVLDARNKLVAHSDFKGVYTNSTHTEDGVELLSVRPAPIVMIKGEEDSLDIDSAVKRSQIHAENTNEDMEDLIQDVESAPEGSRLIIREDRMFDIDVEHCNALIKMIEKLDDSISDEIGIDQANQS